MRLLFDDGEPTTADWRLRQCLARWYVRRCGAFLAVDPLTPEERSEADWRLSCKREQARDWLRRNHHAKVRAAPNVLPFNLRKRR